VKINLVIRPVQSRLLAVVMEAFAAFSPDFMSEGCDFNEQKKREWGDKT
jgi:virulence-associated protein VagC